jgi:hypothetical protein
VTHDSGAKKTRRENGRALPFSSPEVAAQRPSKGEAEAHPRSDVSDFGIQNAQVG